MINKLLTLLFLVILFRTILCEIDLKCNFFTYSNHYECQVFGRRIYNESETVTFSGAHLTGYYDNSVTMLAFYQTLMYYIPKNLFSKFTELTRLECDLCYLKKIEKSDFQNAGNLIHLGLRIGLIKTLQNNLFDYCDKLETINLIANKIENVEEKAFSGLKKLKELYLHHNFIADLKLGTFDDLINLEMFDLENNRIEVVNGNLFKFNKNLQKVWLNYNRIAVLDPNLINHLDKLTYIDFRDNICTDFYEDRVSLIKTTFKQDVLKCTEENRCENKLKSESEELSNRELRFNITISEENIIQLRDDASKKVQENQDLKKLNEELTSRNQNCSTEFAEMKSKDENLSVMQKINKTILEHIGIWLLTLILLNLLCWIILIIFRAKRNVEEEFLIELENK
jgi:hypothetical protein